MLRRMPTTSQLVRKGRTPKPTKLSTPGLKSGKGRKKKVAAPQRRPILPRLSEDEDESLRRQAREGLDKRLAGLRPRQG